MSAPEAVSVHLEVESENVASEKDKSEVVAEPKTRKKKASK